MKTEYKFLKDVNKSINYINNIYILIKYLINLKNKLYLKHLYKMVKLEDYMNL